MSELTREQLEKIVLGDRPYPTIAGGCILDHDAFQRATIDTLTSEVERLKAEAGYHEAKDVIDQLSSQVADLTQQLAASEEMNKGLAASQCEDPIATEHGHVWCGKVKELEGQLDTAMRRQETLAANVNEGLLRIRELTQQLAAARGEQESRSPQPDSLIDNSYTGQIAQLKKQVSELQADRDALQAKYEELEQHQALHDRIFCRQKFLHESLRETVKKAIDDLSRWHSNAEHPAPYESRPAIVRSKLERALEGYYETSTYDALTADLAACREALKAGIKTMEGSYAQHEYPDELATLNVMRATITKAQSALGEETI